MQISTPEELGFSSDRLGRIGVVMQRYVDEGKLAGIVTLVARRGRVVHFEKFGYQDLETGQPMRLDTIFRIYSMTKPITSVALMMLYEQGLFHLTDPVTKFLPEFEKVRVWSNGGKLVEPVRPITIQDLLRHTAGLSYGGYEESYHPVDKLYDDADLFNRDITLEKMVRRIADLPLVHHPGEGWRYSVATDVVGRLVEVISGMDLADFFQEKILGPLGMVDTAYAIAPEKLERFATLYGPGEGDELAILDVPAASEFLPPVRLHAGGHGLISTATDYFRFCQFLLNKGELDGVRLLGPRTVGLMTMNHIPPRLLPICMNEPMPGIGFGLGFRVMMDVAQSGMMGSVGEYGWGGYAETYFWVDPREELIGILMTQYLPSLTYPIRMDFRTLVYQALID